MFGIDHYLVFVISGIILNLTPGSDTIYILTRSIAQGRKAGIYSALGIGTGALTHTIIASFGLSAILSRSLIVFTIIKFIGAAYLFYIGARIMLSENRIFEEAVVDENNAVDYLQIYKQGYFTNLLNPKVALFFLSFLPQFINQQSADSPIPFLILGCTFLTTGTIWCLILALTASMLSKKLRSNPRIGALMQKICGIIFIGLGLKIAFAP